MFILFGFVVAQNFNILKQDLINHQSKANKILENTIKERTADLTKANLMITDSINSASAIQNAILLKLMLIRMASESLNMFGNLEIL